MITRRKHFGFTILELVFVLVIISTTLALAAPSLRGWSSGSKLRDAGDQFLALTRYARAKAVADGFVYRLNVNSTTGRYWLEVQQGQQWAPLGTEWGRLFTVPEQTQILLSGEQGGSLEAIEFYPSGRTLAGSVRFESRNGDRLELLCPSPAEGYRVLTSEEMR
jgi:Tfp pilus assembly protein FimT